MQDLRAGRPAEGMRSIQEWALRQSKHEIYRVQVSTRLPLAVHKPAVLIQQNESGSSNRQKHLSTGWLSTLAAPCVPFFLPVRPLAYLVQCICSFAVGTIIMMYVNVSLQISVYFSSNHRLYRDTMPLNFY